jgi:hypothetical protein
VRFEDVSAAVSPEEGRTAACTKCGAAEGEPCRYVTGRWLNSSYSWTNPGPSRAGRTFLARPGDPMPGTHPERKMVIRARRLEQYRAEQSVSRAALRAWWREHGHIFENANRP